MSESSGRSSDLASSSVFSMLIAVSCLYPRCRSIISGMVSALFAANIEPDRGQGIGDRGQGEDLGGGYGRLRATLRSACAAPRPTRHQRSQEWDPPGCPAAEVHADAVAGHAEEHAHQGGDREDSQGGDELEERRVPGATRVL